MIMHVSMPALKADGPNILNVSGFPRSTQPTISLKQPLILIPYLLVTETSLFP